MSAANRSYQSQFERLHSSSTRHKSLTHSHTHSHTHDDSGATEVQSLSFRPGQRHFPASFHDLSNSTLTHVLHADADNNNNNNNSSSSSERVSGGVSGGGGRYERLLGSLRSSGDTQLQQQQLGPGPAPSPSQFDPMDKPEFLHKQQQQQQQQQQHSIAQTSKQQQQLQQQPQQQLQRGSRAPPAKGILSARVVNDTEWKSIMTQTKSNTQASRARSVSPKKAASSSRAKQRGSGSSSSSRRSATTLSSCLRSHAAGNNALDPSGKLHLVSCYMTELDALPTALAQRVKVLYLSNNSLQSLQGIQQFSNITTLSLTNNSIRYMHHLAPLASLHHLERLALDGNVVTGMPYYRELVLGICSSTSRQGASLQVLDGVKVSADEQSNMRVQFRKVCGQLDLMRCNELRVCVLEHVCALTACHSQLIAEVLGKFRHMLGSHIDTNDDSSGEVFIGRVLQVGLAGGVFRWLQIGCGVNFEERMQDLALRLFYTATRRMTPTARHQLISSPQQLYSFWGELVSECLQHQQQVCAQLSYDCETARDKVASAFSLRRSNEMRISSDKHPLRGSSCEKENVQPLMSSMEGFGIEAWSVLQQLQFDDAGGIFGTMNPRLGSASGDLRGSDTRNRHAWEVQVTYCGIGPHYSYPVADLLNANSVKQQQQFVKDKRALSLKHQQEDHDRAVAHEQAKRNKTTSAGPEDVQSKYMQLLKTNLKKKAGSGKNAPPPPPSSAPPVKGKATGESLVEKSDTVISGFSGFATKPIEGGPGANGGPQGSVLLARQTSADNSVLTGDSDSSEHLGLGWKEFCSEEDEEDEGNDDDDDDGGISLSSYNTHTRSKQSSRCNSLVGSPGKGRHGENFPMGDGDESVSVHERAKSEMCESGSDDDSSTDSSTESSSDSSTDSDMGSVRSGKSSRSAKSSKSAKSVRSIISMKSKGKDGETTVLKLTQENLKMQHTEMLKLTQENLQRPNRMNLFKELGETVQGTANLASVGGSQNGYSIHDYMDEVRSYGRHTESEAASELGSIFSTDEIYTSPAMFLSKDHLEQERLLMKLLDSKKVRDFLESAQPLSDPALAKELPAWALALWQVPGNLISREGAGAGSVVSGGTVAISLLDVDNMTRADVLSYLLGPGGLGPEPVPWVPANTTAAAAPSMKQLTRLFEGASSDFATIQASLKQVVQTRSVLQKQLNKIRNSLKADGIAASKEMEQLAIAVRKTDKINRKAREKWLMAVGALDDLFEIRQNISTGLIQDLEFEENAQNVVEADTRGIVSRKASLLESQEEVAQAMIAMEEDIRTDVGIQAALVEYEASRRATFFFRNPSTLLYSRRNAFTSFRRRVRRQQKIKLFYKEMLQVRRLELMYICLTKLKKFQLKQKRHKLAQAWLLRSKRQRIWAIWRTQFRLSGDERELTQRRNQRLVKSSLQQWRGESIRASNTVVVENRQARRVQEFRRKWIFLKWKQLAKKNRIKGAITDYSLDSKTLLKRAKTYHIRKLFIGWKKVYLQREADLLDREVVLLSLSKHRLVDSALARWCMSYTGCHHWKSIVGARVVGNMRRIAHLRRTYRQNREVAIEFYIWRGFKVALLKLERNCRRRSGLRARAKTVQEKCQWKIIVASYSKWRLVKNEEVKSRLQTIKAMTLYMCHVTRKAWKALLLFYWQSVAERQQRKLTQLQNLRYRSDAALPKNNMLKTPAGFKNEVREAQRLKHKQALQRSHNELLSHPELRTIDMISDDDDESGSDDGDDGSECSFVPNDDVQRAAPATQYTTGIDWGAELLRITGSSDNKTVATPSQPVLCLSNEMKAIPSHSRPITRVRMKRMKNSDNHQESAPFKLQSKSSTRPSHAKPQACSVHPLVERLKCRQMWRRWFLESKRNARGRQVRRRLYRNSTLRVTRRCFNFLFHKWTTRCHKRMVAAHALQGTDSQFMDTIKDYNVEINNQKSELTALRVKVDDAQAQLAAAHCEADTQSSQLSKLMARHDELVQTQQTVDTDRCQIQEQIRAVLLYCGQTPTPPIDPSIAKSELEHSTSVSADETMRRVTEKVGEEARSRLMETRSGLAPCTVEGNIATTDSSLQSIRARIDEYAKAKHDIEEQIEEQHRATHGVHQQYALEKHQLAQAQAGVRQVCGQYGVLLQELEDQVEQYKQQRHDAEHVLRECSFALEVAVDTMNQKQKQFSLHLDDLDLQYQALQFTQQQAEEEEAHLRQELECLREEGDGQDRQRMECTPLTAMAKTELAASDYRVTSEAELELAEQTFYRQQRESAGALSVVVTGEGRRNAGEESAMAASQLLSQEKKESLNQGSLARLHLLRGGIRQFDGKLKEPRFASQGQNSLVVREEKEICVRYPPALDISDSLSSSSSSGKTGTEEVASITNRIGLLSSRIKSRLGGENRDL